ncbi:MAG: hypothetical protein Q8N53_00265 [Longimicrobiales bacterium]|nr:hypothetical protein [Longimicrobiales bacterium]
MQISTEEMQRTSEYGIAAHWRYKEREGEEGTGAKVNGRIASL